MLDKMWPRNVNVDEKLNTLREEMKYLVAMESDNFTLVENAEIQPGKKRRAEVDCWFKNVQDKRTKFEQIEAAFQGKSSSNNLKNRIENLTEEVRKLIELGKFPRGVALDDHASTSIPLTTGNLVGQSFSENIKSILSWLNEDNVFAIGIHGMGGVGKTTLMTHIHDKVLENSEFEKKVYWITASQECSLRKLQIDIGKALGLNDISQYDDERRKAILFQRFSQLGKFVLFIDDLWNDYLIEDIGIPCSSGGCKMILSTRSLDVCNRMNCKKTIKIASLSEPDAMELFLKTLEAAVPAKSDQVAKEIVKECGGLPLALKTMGCSMRGLDDVQEWKNALCELKTPVIWPHSMEERVFKVLKFSYNNLKDKNLQHCFLSCVLFPEDYDIDVAELVNLWINEGLLDEVESDKDKMIRGRAIVKRLEKSGLLESGTNENCVKMHDLIRDMAIIITQDSPRFIAESGKNLDKVPEKKLWSEDLLKVSLRRNRITKIPSDFSPMTMKLSVILLNGNPLREIPESFFIHMRELRVLNLSHTDIERLPNSVGKLENLRILDLSTTNIERLPNSVGKLENLRILDLSKSNIERLPNSVGKFENLRILDLSYSKIERLPNSVGQLKNLRTLNLCYTDIKRLPDSVSNLENLRELLLDPCCELTYIPSLARLTNLRVLQVHSHKFLERAPKEIEGLKELEKITFSPWNANDMSGCCRLLKSLPSLTCFSFLFHGSRRLRYWTQLFLDYKKTVWISDAELGEDETILLPNTIDLLSIQHCEMKGRKRLGDIFSSLGVTTDLQELYINACSGLEYIMPETQPNTCIKFDPLEMKLRRLPDLKRIVEVGGCSFYNLKKLCISHCPKIKEVFQLTNHQPSLPNLEVLEVCDCDELEQIFESNNANPPNSILVLPKLQYIELDCLPKLVNIYKGLLLYDTPLKTFIVPKLKVLEGENLICDASSSTLAFIKSEHSKEWWDNLNNDYPQAASTLSCLINNMDPFSEETSDESNTVAAIENEREEKDDDPSKWGALLSLSLPRHCRIS